MKINLQNFITIFAIFLIIGVFCVFSNVEKVESVASDNVSGWAWSDNIGWICFNSVTDGSANDYGVNIKDDGEFEGYAWSDNAGWITFNKAELGGCPQGACKAKLNKDTGEVSGWAKVISSDNWIRLSDRANGFADDDVYIDITGTGDFHNFAWSEGPNDNDDIGWISFNSEGSGPDYKVKTTFQFVEQVTVGIKANGSNGPITIANDATADLEWDSEYADECTTSCSSVNGNNCDPNNDWTNIGFSVSSPDSGAYTTANLVGPDTYTYEIECSNSIYSASDSVDVVVRAPDGEVTLSASPTTIAHDGTTRLTWTSNNIEPSSCESSCLPFNCDPHNVWHNKARNDSGFQDIDNLAGTQTYAYTIKCKDLNGVDVSDSVNVIVNASVATLWIEANGDIGSTIIPFDTSATLTWGSNNILSGTCNGFCVSNSGLNDCDDPLNLWTDGRDDDDFVGYNTANLIGPDIYTYTIECDDTIGGKVSAFVDVDVGFGLPLPVWEEISPSY